MITPALLPMAAAAIAAEDGGFAALAPIVDVGLSGILIALVIWFIRRREQLVSSGEWVPRRELDYLIAQYDARLAERDREIERERQVSHEYRAAHETSERARELLSQQVRDAVDALRTNTRFFDAFRARIIDGRSQDLEIESGGDDGTVR